MPADYNLNQAVDAADYVVWRNLLDSNTLLPNDTTPGSITAVDHTEWKAHFGTVAMPGDYNLDQVVDAADYVVWRNLLDSNVNLPNDTTPGSVTALDHTVWRAHFGAADMPGDYSANQGVDAADYVVWRNLLDSNANLPNDTTPGSVTAADYSVWKSRFGSTVATTGQFTAYGASTNGSDSLSSAVVGSDDTVLVIPTPPSAGSTAMPLAVDIYRLDRREQQLVHLFHSPKSDLPRSAAGSLLLARIQTSSKPVRLETTRRTAPSDASREALENVSLPSLNALDRVFDELELGIKSRCTFPGKRLGKTVDD
jgi:hypothetical protein